MYQQWGGGTDARGAGGIERAGCCYLWWESAQIMGKGQQKQIFWKIPKSFSFSLRKTSLTVKIQATHFRSGTYFSSKALPDECKHWSVLCLSLLSLNFLWHTPRNKKTEVSICLVRICNWDIHLVRASKLANPHGPLPHKGRAGQASSRRQTAPVVPGSPGLQHKKKETIVKQREMESYLL